MGNHKRKPWGGGEYAQSASGAEWLPKPLSSDIWPSLVSDVARLLELVEGRSSKFWEAVAAAGIETRLKLRRSRNSESCPATTSRDRKKRREQPHLARATGRAR